MGPLVLANLVPVDDLLGHGGGWGDAVSLGQVVELRLDWVYRDLELGLRRGAMLCEAGL